MMKTAISEQIFNCEITRCFTLSSTHKVSLFLHFFVLIQKNEAKKIKTVLASLKKTKLSKLGGVLEVFKCKALRLRAKEHTEVCD